KEQLGKMLDEDPSLMAKREAIAKRLELYKSARDEIDSPSSARRRSSPGNLPVRSSKQYRVVLNEPDWGSTQARNQP
ncbi:unnamed protein product, partial [Cuscuta campestris]